MMKLLITGKTLAEIHQQIVETAAEIGTMGTDEKNFAESMVDLTKPSLTKDGSTPEKAMPIEVKDGIASIPADAPRFVRPSFPIDMPKAAAKTAEEIGSPEYDSRGIPYDARIHASSRSIKTDGSWRMKKGVEPELVAKVEAEIRRTLPTQTVQGAPLPTSQPVIPPAPISDIKVELPKTDVPPLVASVPTAAPVVEQVAPPSVKDFKPAPHTFDSFRFAFPAVIHDLVKFEKIDQNWINEMKKHYNIKEVWDLMNNEKGLRQLYDHFGHYNMITKMDQTVSV